MKAYCHIRPQPHYRSEAFAAGLEAVGYQVLTSGVVYPIAASDVLVIWNRYGQAEAEADRFEKAGGRVLVCENGYIGADAAGRQLYAISVHGHNGSGQWYPRDGARWQQLGILPATWHSGGDTILVCGQRGIGSRTMASPANWHLEAARQIKAITQREVVIRLHPEDRGAPREQPPLEQQLARAWACVIWSSGAGVQALIAGVPVVYCAPHWICKDAARHGVHLLNDPLRSDSWRQFALERMAWAQWTVDEIAAGLPFRHLLERAPA